MHIGICSRRTVVGDDAVERIERRAFCHIHADPAVARDRHLKQIQHRAAFHRNRRIAVVVRHGAVQHRHRRTFRHGHRHAGGFGEGAVFNGNSGISARRHCGQCGSGDPGICRIHGHHTACAHIGDRGKAAGHSHIRQLCAEGVCGVIVTAADHIHTVDGGHAADSGHCAVGEGLAAAAAEDQVRVRQCIDRLISAVEFHSGPGSSHAHAVGNVQCAADGDNTVCCKRLRAAGSIDCAVAACDDRLCVGSVVVHRTGCECRIVVADEVAGNGHFRGGVAHAFATDGDVGKFICRDHAAAGVCHRAEEGAVGSGPFRTFDSETQPEGCSCIDLQRAIDLEGVGFHDFDAGTAQCQIVVSDRGDRLTGCGTVVSDARCVAVQPDCAVGNDAAGDGERAVIGEVDGIFQMPQRQNCAVGNGERAVVHQLIQRHAAADGDGRIRHDFNGFGIFRIRCADPPAHSLIPVRAVGGDEERITRPGIVRAFGGLVVHIAEDTLIDAAIHCTCGSDRAACRALLIGGEGCLYRGGISVNRGPVGTVGGNDHIAVGIQSGEDTVLDRIDRAVGISDRVLTVGDVQFLTEGLDRSCAADVVHIGTGKCDIAAEDAVCRAGHIGFAEDDRVVRIGCRAAGKYHGFACVFRHGDIDQAHRAAVRCGDGIVAGLRDGGIDHIQRRRPAQGKGTAVAGEGGVLHRHGSRRRGDGGGIAGELCRCDRMSTDGIDTDTRGVFCEDHIFGGKITAVHLERSPFKAADTDIFQVQFCTAECHDSIVIIRIIIHECDIAEFNVCHICGKECRTIHIKGDTVSSVDGVYAIQFQITQCRIQGNGIDPFAEGDCRAAELYCSFQSFAEGHSVAIIHHGFHGDLRQFTIEYHIE